MRLRSALLATAAAGTLAVAGLAPATPAAAAPAALLCNDYAISLHYDRQAAAKEYGPYTTTSHCHDINMKLNLNNGQYLDACVVFVDHTTLCNHNNAYVTQGPNWSTVATDVKDGTRFKLRIHAYDADAQHVDFKISF